MLNNVLELTEFYQSGQYLIYLRVWHAESETRLTLYNKIWGVHLIFMTLIFVIASLKLHIKFGKIHIFYKQNNMLICNKIISAVDFN